MDCVVYDLNGKVVLRRDQVSGSDTTFDLSLQAAGTYILRVTTADGRTSARRIVKK